MPELPEVETIKRQLHKLLIGLKIVDVWTDTPKMVKGVEKEIVDGKVVDVRRRAKLLEIDLNNGRTILIHLKMTGQLIYVEKDLPAGRQGKAYKGQPLAPLKKPIPNKSTHVSLHFDNGATLYFNDLRKFGYVKILPTQDVEHTRILNEFGPEPFDPNFKAQDFIERLKKRKNMKIKQLLLDQKFMAGVGNIYANEALFRSKIDPRRLVSTLSDSESKELFAQIKEVLEIGIKAGGASDQTYVDAYGDLGSFMDYAQVYGMKDKPCPVCGTRLQRIALGGRGTFFCSVCQK